MLVKRKNLPESGDRHVSPDIHELGVPTPVRTELWELSPPHALTLTHLASISLWHSCLEVTVYSDLFELVCCQYYSSKKSLIIGEVHSLLHA